MERRSSSPFGLMEWNSKASPRRGFTASTWSAHAANRGAGVRGRGCPCESAEAGAGPGLPPAAGERKCRQEHRGAALNIPGHAAGARGAEDPLLQQVCCPQPEPR